jgi:type II secretory pathway pseudopilin PulG
MSPRIKPSSSPSPRRFFSRRRGGDVRRGYALLIMMMMVTLLLVSLAAGLPSVYTEGQREREEELIFRGNEYARAIALFRRRFNRFPNSVNELLRTNGIRFLRHAYPDPMSRSGKWRFIHANINGTLLDSKTTNNLLPAALANQQNPADASKGQSLFNGPGPPTGTSSFLGGGKEIQGAFIAGVASSSTRESIRVLNQRRHYDEWEFLGVEGSAGVGSGGSVGVGRPPAQPAAPAQPAQPATPASPGPQIPSMPPLTDQAVPPQ